ncbi:hypothetical protein NAL32_07500 [Chryseobacterium sp. Ch-15]|uniref:Uncharacterized protein n=1 Tax=Chryseobacterium muglaense TaxID=2893752 RepID=A0A9Q3YPA7_9FLAO|nr:hypothetical protein [Chryseobacterium muglaense]MBD3904475.1 hypothetical protein [Chryseobacterium muglaense]MCC9032706.1 hypothetical protein [Chryseobacterium muglaense]MCM2554237.1 hypothetical protein [Chryseobacterium muglaense]
MILLNNLSQLQQYNLAYKEDLYFQPIVLPTDISLQGFLPKQIHNDYSIEIILMSWDGDEFIADITDSFKVLFATSSNNQNYFNIQLKEFIDIFNTTELFTLKIIVRNAGFFLFSKITEPFRKLKTSKICYAIIDDFAMMIISKAGYIKINNDTFQFGQGLQDSGFELDYNEGNYYLYVDCLDVVQVGYCYKGEDVKINLPLIATEFLQENGCQLPLIKLSATYNCFDNVKNAYYGDPKTLLNYPGNNQTLIHQNSFYIQGQLQQQPAEIKRNITFLGKPQRAENVEKLSVFGLEVFPDWKMREIESVLSGRRIFIDGIEYIYRGAKSFIRDEIQGSNSWIFKTELENAPKVNDFTCIEDCITNCYYFVITSGTKDQDYYKEDKSKIGDTYQELLDYFNSLNDVISVTDVNVATIGCNVTAVLKIDSFGYVPSFIYYKMPINEYRIFVKFDDCQSPIKLCEGMTNCSLLPSDIKSTYSIFNGCALVPSQITSSSEFDRLYQSFRYTVLDEKWNDINSYDFRRYSDGVVELYFQAMGPNDTYDLIDEFVLRLDSLGVPTTAINESYENVSIYIDNDGFLFVTGNTTNNMLTFKITYTI